jgi:Skp family chaperone for outer membrane proteins
MTEDEALRELAARLALDLRLNVDEARAMVEKAREEFAENIGEIQKMRAELDAMKVELASSLSITFD